jgi:hypothetical protein
VSNSKQTKVKSRKPLKVLSVLCDCVDQSDHLLIGKGSRVVNGLFEFLNALRWVIVAETFPNEPTGECFNGAKVTVDSLRCPALQGES